ncbi:hypothetical protein BH23GEM9_BH23GEM9_32190 [soil metagenome]
MKLQGKPRHRTAEKSSWSRRLALLVLVPAACSGDGSGQSEASRAAAAHHGSAAGADSGATNAIRFGEMYRNGGRHDGQQIVPESWVRQSLTPRTGARRPGEGYGYGWFLSQVAGYPMFYAWGYGGQFLFVVPALELTVVTTSDPDVVREGDHLRAVRRILRELIVPAAVAGHGTGARNS